jgi:hypothetical protein
VLSVCDDVCVPCVCVFVCGCVKIVKFNNNKQSTITAAATNYNSNKKIILPTINLHWGKWFILSFLNRLED